MKRIALVLLVTLAGLTARPAVQAQMPPVSRWQGQSGLGLALRQLQNTGVMMYVCAHPDDENNAVLAALGWGQGIRTIVLSATRGDGGQNEIGPELFNALAVLRTEELVAAQQLDGHDQYFARAVDFGYSFSPEETFEKWAAARSSATSSVNCGGCAPTSSPRCALTAPAAASTTRRPPS